VSTWTVSTWTKIGCWRHRTELEELVSGRRLRAETGSQLEAHLSGCADCREALDDALLATELLRDEEAEVASVDRFSNQFSTAFSTRVMASIREEISRRSAPDVIWRPLEMLASRFAVGAAAVLLMFSIYLAEFAPPFRPATVASQGGISGPSQAGAEAAQAEAGAVMPEPPAQPSNPDEVLVSLAGEGQ
jgi:hypothetical protein